MYFYLYQITNRVNGKIYVGVHKTKNLDDSYMGSGVAIKSAIQKYGIDNFEKVILETFDDADSMYLKESEIVNDEFLSRGDVYNVRRGGHGGFDHINKDPDLTEKRLLAFRNSPNMTNCGGTKHWTEDSRVKVITQAALNNELGLTRGWHHTDEFKSNQSKKMAGEKNSQYGTIWCVEYDASNLTHRKKFKIGFIPEGWVTTKEWAESRKDKSKSSYGRRWYNDGVRNFYLLPEDIPPNLTRGRLM